jgi:hypothetical protein
MNLQNTLETVKKLNEFKKTNKEFTLTELKNYLRSINMKGVNGITLNLLKMSNVCLKQNKKLVWATEEPINYIQVEHIIKNSLDHSNKISQKYREKCKNRVVDVAETIAFETKISFWSKIKNFLKKLR